MASKSTLAGLVCCGFAFILAIVSIATPHWLHHGTGYDVIQVGLFQICFVAQRYCGDMDDLHKLLDGHEVVWFQLVQICFTLGVVGCLICTVAGGLICSKFLDTVDGYRMISIINIITFALFIVPLAIMGNDGNGMFIMDASETRLSWSFCVAIAAEVFVFLGIVCHLIEACNAAKALRSIQQRLSPSNGPYRMFVNQE